MNKLTIDKLEQLTTNSNLIRGQSYYQSGMVKDIIIVNNHLVQASVSGNKRYKVIILKAGHNYKSFCSCPYDSYGFCKHSVAVNLAAIASYRKNNDEHLTIKRYDISGFQKHITSLKFRCLYLIYKVIQNLF